MNLSSSFAINCLPVVFISLIAISCGILATVIPSYNWIMLYLKKQSRYQIPILLFMFTYQEQFLYFVLQLKRPSFVGTLQAVSLLVCAVFMVGWVFIWILNIRNIKNPKCHLGKESNSYKYISFFYKFPHLEYLFQRCHNLPYQLGKLAAVLVIGLGYESYYMHYFAGFYAALFLNDVVLHRLERKLGTRISNRYLLLHLLSNLAFGFNIFIIWVLLKF